MLKFFSQLLKFFQLCSIFYLSKKISHKSKRQEPSAWVRFASDDVWFTTLPLNFLQEEYSVYNRVYWYYCKSDHTEFKFSINMSHSSYKSGPPSWHSPGLRCLVSLGYHFLWRWLGRWLFGEPCLPPTRHPPTQVLSLPVTSCTPHKLSSGRCLQISLKLITRL